MTLLSLTYYQAALSTTPQVSNEQVLRPSPSGSLASTSTALPPEMKMVRTKKGSLIAANRIRKLHQVSTSRGNLSATGMRYRGISERGRGRPTRSNPALSHLNNRSVVDAFPTLANLTRWLHRGTRIKRLTVAIDKPCRHFTTRGMHIILFTDVNWRCHCFICSHCSLTLPPSSTCRSVQ